MKICEDGDLSCFGEINPINTRVMTGGHDRLPPPSPLPSIIMCRINILHAKVFGYIKKSKRYYII